MAPSGTEVLAEDFLLAHPDSCCRVMSRIAHVYCRMAEIESEGGVTGFGAVLSPVTMVVMRLSIVRLLVLLLLNERILLSQRVNLKHGSKVSWSRCHALH